MKQKKSVVQQLVTYTAILLTPVIVIGLLMVFLYLGRLEKNFEELNTKTIEAANQRLDLVLQEAPVINYQLSTDADANTFLFRNFESKHERVTVLKRVRESIQSSLVNRNAIADAVLYSQRNDIFISQNTLYDRQEFYTHFFSGSSYTQEDLFALLETVKTAPLWLITEDYLIYCSGMRSSSYYGNGLFFAFLEKQTLLDTWKEVLGNLEINCALFYRDQELLLQTEHFQQDIYEACRASDSCQNGYMVKQYSSQKIGNFFYAYTIDYEHLGGDVAAMVRSLALVTLLLLLVSICLALRKARTIQDMYTAALEQSENLEDQLNLQVEELNQQRLHNALRGYDYIAPEKQGAYSTGNRIRVLIYRVAGEKEPREQLWALAEDSFAKENIELQYLFEKDMGYTCILSYATRENLIRAVNALYQALSESCGSGIHMGLSSEIHKLIHLADACEQAVTALHYCQLQEPDGGIIHYTDISELEKGKVYYPPEKEAQLLRNIRMGMRDKVEEALDRVYQINFKERRLSGGMIRQLLVKMLNTLYSLADTAYSDEPQEQTNLGWLSRNVLLTKNRSEAFCTLRDMMLSVCDKCAEQKEGELRRRIVAYIGENFRDPDLSLEKMAADFDMSYHHLSRLFNECMQMNFASYLAGLRLEYSTELLKTTQLSVEQVAQQAGFLQSGTFIRVFKKYYGVTPGKFREDHRHVQQNPQKR